MTIKEPEPYNAQIISMMDKLSNINRWRKTFLLETLILFLSIRERINFLQLTRCGKYKEQRYRQRFEKCFDFLTYNKELTLSQGSGRYAAAFDPSYVSKSGKKTPVVGWYWSGCAGKLPNFLTHSKPAGGTAFEKWKKLKSKYPDNQYLSF